MKPVTQSDITEAQAEWIEERAAIMEYEGGLDRDIAEIKALELWLNLPSKVRN